LVFHINAGEKYYFNNLKLNIPENYSIDNFKNILNLFDKLKGKIYSLNKIEKILNEIDKIVLTKEFEFINAKYDEVITKKNKINLTIKLEETEKTYIEKINIYGNYITDENVIRNSLIVDEGDAYNQILINKSINDIRSKNIFKSVKTVIEENETWKVNFFEGVPSPAAAGLVLSPLILNLSGLIQFENYAVLSSVTILTTSVLMVSKIPTYSLKRILIPRHLAIFLLLGIGIYVSLLIFYTFETLFFSAIIYIILIPISYFHYKYKSKTSLIATNEEETEDIL